MGSGSHRRLQVPHPQLQDPRNGGTQTAIGLDRDLDTKECDQRKACRQEIRPRTNANSHPGWRENENTNFVKESGDACPPQNILCAYKTLFADDERQPRGLLHAYGNFAA